MGDAAMEDGADALPGRSMQVLRLLQLFGPPTARTPSCIFVYGATSAGKTHVVRTVLRQQRLPHAMVDAVECYTPRLVFEQIINEVREESHCRTCRLHPTSTRATALSPTSPDLLLF